MFVVKSLLVSTVLILTLTGCVLTAWADFSPAQYDLDGNGSISKDEVIAAINDYLFDDTITKAQVIEVINAYLFGDPVATPTPRPIPTPTPTPTPVPDPTVRVIYATPSDVEPNPTYITALENAIYDVQRWYAEKLDGQTFAVQAPTPKYCTLPNPEDYYAREGGYHRVVQDLQHCVPIWYESTHYVWAVYPDVSGDCELTELGGGGYGITILHRDDLEGLSKPEGHTHCGYYRPHGGWIGGLAHELGHAFGLPHPPGCDEGLVTCDRDAMMYAGYAMYPNTYLTEADMATLRASPWFYVRLSE